MANKEIVLGFHRAEISIFNDTQAAGTVDSGTGTIISVNNGGAEGAAQELKIDGLAGETKKQYGNNGVAYVSSRPIGDLKATLTALGIPTKDRMALVGAKNQDDKIFNVSSDDKVPSVGLWFESDTDNGKTACLGIYSCKASLGDINWKTMDDGAYEPKGEEFTFASETDGREATKNSYYVMAIFDDIKGSDKTNYQKLRDYVLRITTPGELSEKDVEKESKTVKK